MVAPILIATFVLADSNDNLLRFRSLNALLEYVEPVDVDCGEYRAWDGIGRRVEMTAYESGSIRPSEGRPDEAALRGALLAYIRRTTPSSIHAADSLSLANLAALVEEPGYPAPRRPGVLSRMWSRASAHKDSR